jgi:hypothetical protein
MRNERRTRGRSTEGGGRDSPGQSSASARRAHRLGSMSDDALRALIRRGDSRVGAAEAELKRRARNKALKGRRRRGGRA